MSQRWQTGSNRFTLTNTVPPTEEPVSLLEAKNHLKIDDDILDDDNLITSLIMSARMEAENICRRVLCSSTWRFTLDRFPNSWDVGAWSVGYEAVPGRILEAGGYARGTSEISLPLSPVTAISSIKYTDTSGALQTLDPAQYESDVAGYPATITPAFSASWPGIRQGRAAIAVEFVAGYGTADDVPAPIKTWILVRTATLYRNRESVALFRGTIQDFSYVDRLLDPYRIVEF